MSIIITKRPYDRNWSGNPIHYTLYSAAAESDATIFFEIRIRFMRTDQSVWSNVITLPYQPVSGTAKVDINGILNGLLEYELPLTPAVHEYNSPHFANKATGRFYIQFREITTATPDPAWDDTESAYDRFVIKGGISFEKWRGDNYWTNYFDQVKPFLTWEKSGMLHSLKERMYLAWLNLTAVYVGNIQMKRTIRYTDGTQDTAYLNFPAPAQHVCYFPAGGAQLELEAVDPTKTIHWWELQVMNVGLNPQEPLSEPFRYYVDNRQDYNGITLNYRNSLGGISSARVRGVIDYSLERKFTPTERIVLHDYFNSHFVPGRVQMEDSSELLIYKGDLGHLTKEEQDRHRDLHLSRETWWEQDKKWMPVAMLTGSNRLRLSTDKLFAFPVEFAIASGEDYYYTPQSVNLAEGSAPTSNVCTAIIGSLGSSYTPGVGWTINWSLVSGSPVKYMVSTPGVSGGAPRETTSTSILFDWLPVGNNVITVQPVCEVGGQLYLGTAQQLTVVVAAACVNVGISGAPVYLPDAVSGTPYSYIINLTGTAPFSLGSIVKPSWMSISVVGSTIEFSGTPGPGDVIVDETVSFTVSNCSGSGSASFSDLIDVLASGGSSGSFEVQNITTDGVSFIKMVQPNSPAFYSFSSGGFPVTMGQTATGVLTNPISTAISLQVVIASSNHAIQLYKNGALMQTIFTPTTGTYSFDPVSYLLTDNMTIVLIKTG